MRILIYVCPSCVSNASEGAARVHHGLCGHILGIMQFHWYKPQAFAFRCFYGGLCFDVVKVIDLGQCRGTLIERVKMTYLRLALGKIVNGMSSICIVLVGNFEENGICRRLVGWLLLSGPGRARAYSFPD